VLPFALVNNYGPTENAVVATSGPVVSKGNDPPSIGLPIDNVWVQIVDRRLQAVPRGARGELIVGGRSLASGYWNQPSLTAERFVTLADGSRVYRTGDVCRMRRNGEIEFLGRIDSQVKVRGCRIELSEIENALMAHGSIRDAVARVRESDNGSKRIVAYIVPEDDSISAESVRHFLANWLPAYMIPSSFVAIEAVPRTTNGKIDDERLREIDAQPISATVYRVPTTNTEREIESLWRNLLGLGAISVNDDFFQLGGDSLMATRFAVTIREKFAVDLPLAQMLKAPTIAAVAAWIDDAERAGPELPAGVIQLKEGRKSLAPLFLAPPASGSPSCYLVFAGAIQIDRPVYAFEAPGFTSGSAIACFKTQARKYVELLRAVQPRGPYYLAGWSLGGTVAFEMARQLREANFEVAYLGLLDAAVPENGRFPGGLTMIQAMRRVLSYSAGEGFPLNYRSLWLFGRAIGIAAPESFSDLRRRGWRGGARFLGTMVAQSWRSLLVLMANLRALKRYQPSSFDGEVTLFQTAPDANARDLEINLRENVGRWARSVSVHDAPGSHLTLFLNPRHAASFALSVGETIDSSTMTQRL
jgi:thioesterase domain-containing protein/acyl carrier protein